MRITYYNGTPNSNSFGRIRFLIHVCNWIGIKSNILIMMLSDVTVVMETRINTAARHVEKIGHDFVTDAVLKSGPSGAHFINYVQLFYFELFSIFLRLL